MKTPFIITGKTISEISPDEVNFNTRVKMYPDFNGGFYVTQVMCCNKRVFNPNGYKLSDKTIAERKLTQIQERFFAEKTAVDVDEIPVGVLSAIIDKQYAESEKRKKENADRAVRRAKTVVYDLACCNDFKYFVTLTLNGEHFARDDFDTVKQKFLTWCKNRVYRQGMKYIAVAEYHKKNNAVHFHLLTNEALAVVDSGTVLVPNYKKPIKIATADRRGVPLYDRRTVYNVSDWKYGFSTAIELVGDRRAVAGYVCKYITKDCKKIGGRYYYSGGELMRPKYEYFNCDFVSFEADREFSVDGFVEYKILNM
ncbi:MAG: hypothetical protein ACI4IS_05075 [Acutalibacteraceae bacterium]